jgi:hypothetical protein
MTCLKLNSASVSELAELFNERHTFELGKLSAFPAVEAPEGWLPLLPAAELDTFYRADYIVRLHRIPVAWHTQADGWIVPGRTQRSAPVISSAISLLPEWVGQYDD